MCAFSADAPTSDSRRPLPQRPCWYSGPRTSPGLSSSMRRSSAPSPSPCKKRLVHPAGRGDRSPFPETRQSALGRHPTHAAHRARKTGARIGSVVEWSLNQGYYIHDRHISRSVFKVPLVAERDIGPPALRYRHLSDRPLRLSLSVTTKFVAPRASWTPSSNSSSPAVRTRSICRRTYRFLYSSGNVREK
jgi:hypothetical protein